MDVYINIINNNKLINVEKSIIRSIFCLKIQINHIITYSYYEYAKCSYILYYSNMYSYIKMFNMLNYFTYDCYYRINKNSLTKHRMLNTTTIIHDIIYSYFIYNKYYTYSDIKKYFTIQESITSKKRFNCRDFYKIYSYI